MLSFAPQIPSVSVEEAELLRRENQQLKIERRILELKVEKLTRQLWGKKSERLVLEDDKQKQLFQDPAIVESNAAPTVASSPSIAEKTKGKIGTKTKKGPKPLDPALPREVIPVADPELKDLICPVTRRPMQPGYQEVLEVLARRAPEYYVKRYERWVFVSPEKTAPAYSPWPGEVLPRSRVHASIVAHIASAHYCDHVPFNRIEKQLARIGVDLPRNCQVSLMTQLDEIVAPLLKAHKAEVFGCGYIQLDATCMDVCDPDRPGGVRQAALWAYRASNGAVWFEFQLSKSTQWPDATLREVNFKGFCQTDGAAGLDDVGIPGQVIPLGCHTHNRRPIFEAHEAGDPRADAYLKQIGKIFRVERIAKDYGFTKERRQLLRNRFSLPIFDAIVAQSAAHAEIVPKKTALGDAVRYTLGQQEKLRRTLLTPEAEISTNSVERAIRPLKIGSKNWIFVGHPKAGSRLANLFTLVENCRLLGIDPERYLIDVITRLPDHPNKKIAELLPHHWTGPRTPSVDTS